MKYLLCIFIFFHFIDTATLRPSKWGLSLAFGYSTHPCCFFIYFKPTPANTGLLQHFFSSVTLAEHEYSEAGMSKAHVRRYKGSCVRRRHEAVRGNAVSADTRVSGASFCRLPFLLLRFLMTLLVLCHCHCQGLCLTSLHRWHATS